MVLLDTDLAVVLWNFIHSENFLHQAPRTLTLSSGISEKRDVYTHIKAIQEALVLLGSVLMVVGWFLVDWIMWLRYTPGSSLSYWHLIWKTSICWIWFSSSLLTMFVKSAGLAHQARGIRGSVPLACWGADQASVCLSEVRFWIRRVLWAFFRASLVGFWRLILVTTMLPVVYLCYTVLPQLLDILLTINQYHKVFI